MPALRVQRPTNDVVYLSAGQIHSDIGAASSPSNIATLSRHESHTRQTLYAVPSAAARSRTLRVDSNQLAPGVATSSRSDVVDSKECTRQTGGIGSSKANAAPEPMRGTKAYDRPDVNGQSRFSAASRRTVAHQPTADDDEKRQSDDDKLVKRSGPPIELPSPSPPMPPPPPPLPPTETLNLRSTTRPTSFTSTAASATLFPAPLVNAPPSPTARAFSAATVITLSTILPTIIVALLAVIFYLLRVRRKVSSVPRSRDNSLPPVDVRQDIESPRSDPPYIALSQHSISPFNVSLHDLGKSLFFAGESRTGTGVGVEHAPSPVGTTKSNLSCDSGLAHHSDVQLPSLPAPAHMRQDLPPTPVLAVRYPSNPAANASRLGHRTSIYVERTSVDSGAASSVVFARERTEEGSTGRISRDGLSRWGSRDARTSLSEFPGRRPSAPSSDQHGASGTPLTGEYGAHGPGRSSSKALKMLGIGPSSPHVFPLPARTHRRSSSQPVTTYGLPSLQLSPRARALRGGRRPSPSEVNPRGDGIYSASSGRVHDAGSRAETQRIHPYLPYPSPPLPPLPSSSAPGTSPSRSSRERQPLSITIPPRLGAPIRPVAELIAMQSPSPPYTHARRNTPRSRSASRTPGIVSPSQLSDLGVLERAHAAFSRPRGMSDSEPSPETRERVLRLLGRLPENAQGESDVHNGEERENFPGTEQRVQGEERVREVRRTRSESMLSGAFLQPPSDA